MDPIASVLAVCLDPHAVWSIDHEPDETACARPRKLLVFADAGALARLRKCPQPELELLVVTDGDYFESAWGPRLSGSLARWAWRQTSPREAYYDEARWAPTPTSVGEVVRVRRKAFLVWQAQEGFARLPVAAAP